MKLVPLKVKNIYQLTTYQKQTPLITAETLIKLPINTQIIKYNRLNVAKVETLPIWKVKKYTEGKSIIIKNISINYPNLKFKNDKNKTLKEKIDWLISQSKLNDELKILLKTIKTKKIFLEFIEKYNQEIGFELIKQMKENNII